MEHLPRELLGGVVVVPNVVRKIAGNYYNIIMREIEILFRRQTM